MELIHVIAGIIVSLGAFFLLIGSVGLIRLPDFYSRAHAQGKADTLGMMLVIFGLLLTQGFSVNSAKLLIIIAFIGLTNPTATNALVKAAYFFRQIPWFKEQEQMSTGENSKETKD
jgi:multicomponent Na+:H+ antiporter subunit G